MKSLTTYGWRILVSSVLPNHQRIRSVVWTNGCFDLLHEGHLYLLEKCHEYGNRLIVGLNSDESVRRLKGPNRPAESFETRRRKLYETGLVDLVVPIEDDPSDIIAKIYPDVLIKGPDYIGKENEILGRRFVGCVIAIESPVAASTTQKLKEAQRGSSSGSKEG